MSLENLLDSLSNLDDESKINEILSYVLPKKDQSYTLDEVDSRVHQVRDEVELKQRCNNDRFEGVLDDVSLDRLKNLYQNLHNIQLDMMKLQCDIAFAKEQFDTVESVCNNQLVQERKDILIKEVQLKKSLQEFKFKPLKSYFENFTDYLHSRVVNCLRSTSNLTPSSIIPFNWSQYYQVVFLIRACGKTLLDMEKFERLYQSDVDLVGVTFKQSIDQTDFGKFIEFYDNFSLETLLEIEVSKGNKIDLKEFESQPHIEEIFRSTAQLSYNVFESSYHKLKVTTADCCKLVVDLNMNYIEAHLTDGINIDKLNESENSSLTPLEEQQTLPIYAFSPQKYIMQIGQHLLTLSKQTEQFDNMDKKSIMHGLKSLRLQNLPITMGTYATVAEIIMQCIAQHCISSLLGRTSQSILSKLTANGRRQLATDALYLDNVLEDLGLLHAEEPNVVKFKSLLILFKVLA